MRFPQLVVGTVNPAKARQLAASLRPLPIVVSGLAEHLDQVPDVVEDGADPVMNAAKKARVYAGLVGVPVLSCDFALTFQGLADEEQPGLNVRRLPGRAGRPSDEELLAYYQGLVRDHGRDGRLAGSWEAGLAVAFPDGRVEVATSSVVRVFTAAAAPTIKPGYPLGSLQLTPDGRYYAEIDDAEEDAFVAGHVGEPVRALVRAAFDRR